MNGHACLAIASLKLFIGIRQLSYFVINTDFFLTTDTERTFLFNWKEKFPFKASFHHSKRYLVLKCPLPALFTWETWQKESCSPPSNFSKLQPLFFVSLFIQNNSTNNSFFLGQQLTEWTSIIKGDGAERKMEAHFLRDWFFKAKTHRHKQEAIYHQKGSTWKSQLKTRHSQDCPVSLKS